MDRADILDQHYGKARGEMAIVFAFVPVAIAIFVIIFAASLGRPNATAMFFALLCAAPLLMLRRNLIGDNKSITYGAGLLLPGAAGYLSTQQLWVTVVTAMLGAASIAVFYFKKDNTSDKPKLNALGQERLNTDLRSAGFEQETF